MLRAMFRWELDKCKFWTACDGYLCIAHTHTVVKFSGEERVKSKASFGMQVVRSVWDCQTRLDKLDNETPPRDLRVSQSDYLRDLTGAPVFTGTFSRLHYQGQSSPTTREKRRIAQCFAIWLTWAT